MSRERILRDLEELLQATEWLVEGRPGFREALQSYFYRSLRLHGSEKSMILIIDDVR